MFNNVYTGNYNSEPIPIMEIDMSFKCPECGQIGLDKELKQGHCPSCNHIIRRLFVEQKAA
jgi:DNA-directed RNA polymerase subunit RPC12/RpoP